MKHKGNRLKVDLVYVPARTVEVLPNGWERLYFDCTACAAEGTLVIMAKFNPDGTCSERYSVSKQCSACKIRVEDAEDSV